MKLKYVVVPLAVMLASACSGSDEDSSSNGASGAGGNSFLPGGSGGFGGPTSCNNNGIIDPGEECDGAALGSNTCSSATMGARPGGTVGCSACRVTSDACFGAAGAGGAPGGTGGSANPGGSGNPGTGGMGAAGAPQGAGGAQGGQGETGVMVGMTEAHNAVRQTVSPENPLPPLAWSPSLAATAQAYAEQLASQGCPLVHSNAPGLGENLAWFGGQPGSAQQSVNMWASEVACYSYGPVTGQNTCLACSSCGHYTQIVWRGTTEVGCGMAACANNGGVWVCNYSPPGNYIGQTPY